MSLIGSNGQLFGWREETWLWLDQAGILGSDIMLTLTLLGAVVAFIKRDRIRSWLRRYRFPVDGDEAASTERWDAIIFTVSKPDLPSWVIQQKSPAAVGLVDTESSRPASEQIVAQISNRGVDVVGPKMVNDADDPAEVREATAWLIQKLRDKGQARIAVDVTGGKTPMSLGAFMAAQEQGCDTLYVSSEFDAKLRKPDMRTATIRCITRASVG